MNKIIERLERETGISDLVSLLAERLEPTDLQSLLLEVYRQRASKRKPSDVLAEYETNRFVRPSQLSPKRLLEWERLLLSELPEVDVLELSPICPLGTNSIIAGVDQNWSVSTARNTEVVSDSTNVLALECALRRRQLLTAQPKSAEAVHVAASHRLLRAQNYGDPKASAHFRLFTLCSAGRDQGNLHFEFSTLVFHLRFYVRSLRKFLGSDVGLQLSISDFSDKNLEPAIESQLFVPIKNEVVNLECVLDNARAGGRGYYQNLCFKIHARTGQDDLLELADGGVVDWTQKLLANAKERLVISGLSSERICTELSS